MRYLNRISDVARVVAMLRSKEQHLRMIQTLSEYWKNRQTRQGKATLGQRFKALSGSAGHNTGSVLSCGEYLLNGEVLQTHHKIAIKEGGGNGN